MNRLVVCVKLLSRFRAVAALGRGESTISSLRSFHLARVDRRPIAEPAQLAEHIEPRATDAELVERLGRGDQWAKEALYRRYVRLVWSTALRLVGNHADAQDVVQDTFVEALRDLPALRAALALKPWLLRITVHQSHRRFRRRKLLRRLGLDRSLDDAPLDSLVQADASPEVRSELCAVERALRAGDARDRAAWLLRYVEGYTLEEIAEACACSLATTKRRLSRAQHAVELALSEKAP